MKTIAFRLMMAFMCIIVFLILQGAFAFQGFRGLENLYRQSFSHEREMDLLRADLAETRLLMYRFISTLNPDQMDEHSKNIEKNLEKINAQLSDHSIRESLINENAELYRKIIDLHTNFYSKTARRILNTTSEDTHNRLFREMQEQASIMANRHKNHVAVARQKTLWTTFGLLVAALLVAGTWALVLVNTLTDRRKAERALQDSEARFRAVFEAARDVSFIITDIVSPVPNVLEVSPGAARIFGYRKEELISGPVSVLHVKKEVERLPDFLRLMQQGKTGFSGEAVLVRKNGEQFPALFAAYPLLDSDNRLYAVLEVCVDISEQKFLEEELQQARKMEAIGTLAGGVAHDFNNILSVIIGNAELALGDIPQTERTYENIEEILTAGMRAKDVVSQLLSYSRKSPVNKEPIDLSKLIEDNKNFIRSSIPASIDIRYQINPPLPPVFADRTQIYQVLLNLTTNAALAMEKNGGILEVELTRVQISDADENNAYDLFPGNYVSLAVKDTGCGIPPGILKRIFDPYFTTREAGKGSGMGLAVVQGIIDYHNGGIHVDSEPGQGTEVRILLPEAQDTPSATANLTEPVAGGTERILFADDEPAIADANRQILERLGYRVQSFTDPENALAAFSAHPDKFDLIISDMTMPKMSGEQLIARIKALRPDIPVILCTGYSEQMDAQKAKAEGINAFLTKPVSKNTMTETIRTVMEQRG